jgi:hypothetical protein
MSQGYRSALHDASPEAWRWLDARRPLDDATDRYAVRFHAAWLRILLQDIGQLGTAPITHQAAARILRCPVPLIATLLDRLRTDGGDGNDPPLTERDFARVAKAN